MMSSCRHSRKRLVRRGRRAWHESESEWSRGSWKAVGRASSIFAPPCRAAGSRKGLPVVPQEGERSLDPSNTAERRTLKWVLGINVTQFAVAGVVGILAQSTGLLGTALDNLGDSAAYGVSLYAVGRTVIAQARAARLSGILLIVLSLGLLGEVIRRFVTGSDPIGWAMILTAVVNAATNLVNLKLLESHRQRGVHLKASWIFTTNDMIANLGIAVSGIAVMIFNSPLPDLLIGMVVIGIVAKGGWEILEHARQARRTDGAATRSRGS